MKSFLIGLVLKILYYLVDKGWEELKEYFEEKKKLEESKKEILKKIKEIENEKLPENLSKREQARLRAKRITDALNRM